MPTLLLLQVPVKMHSEALRAKPASGRHRAHTDEALGEGLAIVQATIPGVEVVLVGQLVGR